MSFDSEIHNIYDPRFSSEEKSSKSDKESIWEDCGRNQISQEDQEYLADLRS